MCLHASAGSVKFSLVWSGLFWKIICILYVSNIRLWPPFPFGIIVYDQFLITAIIKGDANRPPFIAMQSWNRDCIFQTSELRVGHDGTLSAKIAKPFESI